MPPESIGRGPGAAHPDAGFPPIGMLGVVAAHPATHVHGLLVSARHPWYRRSDEATVAAVHRRFDGCRGRDFVPILVERIARDDLAAHL
ncbi:three-helix bundle dimerization domain-containing protein [Rhodococcus jostii]|uniref:three-helix bundle dimerization domain-containing protein n=1 Tax=Rhodococcus jostii TaxID=132919 RepID=UPI00363B898F